MFLLFIVLFNFSSYTLDAFTKYNRPCSAPMEELKNTFDGVQSIRIPHGLRKFGDTYEKRVTFADTKDSFYIFIDTPLYTIKYKIGKEKIHGLCCAEDGSFFLVSDLDRCVYIFKLDEKSLRYLEYSKKKFPPYAHFQVLINRKYIIYIWFVCPCGELHWLQIDVKNGKEISSVNKKFAYMFTLLLSGDEYVISKFPTKFTHNGWALYSLFSLIKEAQGENKTFLGYVPQMRGYIKAVKFNHFDDFLALFLVNNDEKDEKRKYTIRVVKVATGEWVDQKIGGIGIEEKFSIMIRFDNGQLILYVSDEKTGKTRFVQSNYKKYFQGKID